MSGLLKNVALEEIMFQSGMFFKELSLLYAELRELNQKDFEGGMGLAKLEACIEHHTNLKVTYDVDSGQGPAISIPDVDRNNPLVSSFVKGFLDNADGRKMVEAAGGVVRGTVNLKTSKVSGIFAEVKNTLYFPKDYLRKTKFTPEELAAITLHEIGHLFTYFEFLSRTMVTNQVLAGISRVMDNTNTAMEREVVLVSAKKILGLKDFDAKETAKSNNKKVIETVILTSAIREAKDEIGFDIYNANNWEFLADQFAARHGAGRELAIALEKIYKSSFNISFRSTGVFYAMEAVKIIAFVAVIGLAATPAAGFAQILMQFWILGIVIDGPGDPTYDRPGARLKRIRNQIVENLKQGDLSPDDRKRLMADVKMLDEHLEQINDRLQLVSKIWTFISKSARNRIKMETLSKELEELAANELFGLSTELKDLK